MDNLPVVSVWKSDVTVREQAASSLPAVPSQKEAACHISAPTKEQKEACSSSSVAQRWRQLAAAFTKEFGLIHTPIS